MIQTLIKNWWLLALCGVLEAIYSLVNLFMPDPDGFLVLRTHVSKGTLGFLGQLALAAGVCMIAAGIWKSAKGKSWLLVLNGLALSAFGLLFIGILGSRIGFRTVVLLLVVMAVSIGIFELAIARTLRRVRYVAEGYVLGAAGAASIGFALVFLAYGLGWIKLEAGTHPDLLLFGSYFGFSAVCMLGLGLRFHSLDLSQSGPWEGVAPLGNPKHAH